MDLIEELFEKGIVRNSLIERQHKDGQNHTGRSQPCAAEKSGRLRCRKCFINQGYNRQKEI